MGLVQIYSWLLRDKSACIRSPNKQTKRKKEFQVVIDIFQSVPVNWHLWSWAITDWSEICWKSFTLTFILSGMGCMSESYWWIRWPGGTIFFLIDISLSVVISSLQISIDRSHSFMKDFQNRFLKWWNCGFSTEIICFFPPKKKLKSFE